jgi:cell cycle checkpoint control protein RAD9A
MHVLKFTLTPAGVAHVHDAVACLAKFGETVSIEARPDKVGSISLIFDPSLAENSLVSS